MITDADRQWDYNCIKSALDHVRTLLDDKLTEPEYDLDKLRAAAAALDGVERTVREAMGVPTCD